MFINRRHLLLLATEASAQEFQRGRDNLFGVLALLYLLLKSQRFQNGIALATCEESDERPEFANVSGFQRTDVLLPIRLADNKRK